ACRANASISAAPPRHRARSARISAIVAGGVSDKLADPPNHGPNGASPPAPPPPSATARRRPTLSPPPPPRAPPPRPPRPPRPARRRQAQPGPGAEQSLRERLPPPVHRRPLGAQEQRVVVPLDQPGSPGGIAGGQGVVNGLVNQPVSVAPLGRSTVQARQFAR